MDTRTLFDAPAETEEAAVVLVAPPPAPQPVAKAAAPVATGPVLLAVDGNSVAHRAFHAYARDDGRPDVERSGMARYGFLALLAGLCDKVRPDALVVGFDCRDESCRRDVYPEYKEGRNERDPLLTSFMAEIPIIVRSLGVHVIVPPGWEADDVVASAAAAAESGGWRCVVATSDKDSFALVSDRTTVLRLRSGLDNAEEVTPDSLLRDVGVPPDRYVELAALRGDPSDNLPGVRGIGPARAAALLNEFPALDVSSDELLGVKSILGAAAGKALLDDLASDTSVFRRNVGLMSVRRDLPVDLGDCTMRTLTPAQIESVLDSWGLTSLTARLAVAIGVLPAEPPPPGDEDAPVG